MSPPAGPPRESETVRWDGMGYKYDEHTILEQALLEALDNGLSQLTFGSLARRMGISDRSIVYYFPTKDHLLLSVVTALGERLMPLLAQAFGEDPLPPDELFGRAWKVLATPRADPVIGLFFEVVGLGAAGVAPYADLGGAVLTAWLDWVEPFVDAPATERRETAIALVGALDGMLLVRAMLGARKANQAAAHIRFG